MLMSIIIVNYNCQWSETYPMKTQGNNLALYYYSQGRRILIGNLSSMGIITYILKIECFGILFIFLFFFF